MQRAIPLAVVMLLCLAPAAGAQVNLELKYPDGATRRTEIAVKARQVLDIGGMQLPTNSETVITAKQAIGKRRADGRLPVEETIEAIRFKLSFPGVFEAEFDSSKPETKHDIPQVQAVLEGLKALSGASYTLLLDNQHQVVAVEGADEIVKTAPADAQAFLKERLTLEALRREAGDSQQLLPRRAVKKGDRWQASRSTDLGSGQTITFETFFEYDGTVEKGGKTLDKVNVFAGAVKYEMDPNSDSPLKVTKSDLKVDSSTGSFLFDRELGVVVESSATNRVSGPMSFSINGMDLPGKVDLTLETSSRTKP